MRTVPEVVEWMQKYVADVLNVDASAIDPDMSFEQLGLDSSSAVALTGDLESWLDCEIDTILPYSFPTIRLLSERLVSGD